MGIAQSIVLRPLGRLLAAIVLLGGAWAVLDAARYLETRRLQSEIRTLQKQKEELLAYARRLTASRRVAQMDVVRRTPDPAGTPVLDLIWRRIADDGTVGRSQALSVYGDLVYIEAAVIKFDFEIPEPGSLEQRTSLALFRRVFGDRQSPVTGVELDREAPLTGPTSGTAAVVEQNLWELFWQFIDDPLLASRYGIRVAQIEAPAVPMKPGELWEVRLDAAGGVNVRKIGVRDPTVQARPHRESAISVGKIGPAKK